MAGCCNPTDYRRFFNRKFAARDLRRYREDGLSKTERDLIQLAGDVRDVSILEIGGGIGALQLELLQAGAARATNVELSSAYEEAAGALFDEREAERLIGDFIDLEVPRADVVLLHRVVCCYPDVDAMVGKAAANARLVLALTLPQQRRWIGVGLRLVNLWLRLSRCGFRTYRHSFERVAAAAEAEGLHLDRRSRRGLLWESASFVR
jgi:O-methyltransferase